MRGAFIRAALAAPLLTIPGVAGAHLLPKNTATLRVKDNAAFVVVSVPVSALFGVDSNGDGKLDPAETGAGNAAIQQQFSVKFKLLSGAAIGQPTLTMVSLPDGAMDYSPSDYLVVMQRVDFDAPPAAITISSDLFGTGDGEDQLALRATSGSLQEEAVLSASSPRHRFFGQNPT